MVTISYNYYSISIKGPPAPKITESCSEMSLLSSEKNVSSEKSTEINY